MLTQFIRANKNADNTNNASLKNLQVFQDSNWKWIYLHVATSQENNLIVQYDLSV